LPVQFQRVLDDCSGPRNQGPHQNSITYWNRLHFCFSDKAGTAQEVARLTAEMMTKACASGQSSVIDRSMRSEERRVGQEVRCKCDWSSDVCSSDLCRFNSSGF